MSISARLPRLAASSYLNSAPLIWSFLRGSMNELVTFTDPVPSRCADLLAQNAVDIRLVPGVCVGSKEQVRSVVLVTRTDDLKTVRSVALDESSRTSATLIRIIFKEFIGSEPSWRTAIPNLGQMLAENDGALIIGDPGMTFSRDGYQVWDLAALWRQYTGLGFIFAMWMIREDALAAAQRLEFAAARDAGLSALDEIIEHYEQLLPLTREAIVEYLTKNISFKPDQSMSAGLSLYFQLAHSHNLISAVKPVREAV